MEKPISASTLMVPPAKEGACLSDAKNNSTDGEHSPSATKSLEDHSSGAISEPEEHSSGQYHNYRDTETLGAILLSSAYNSAMPDVLTGALPARLKSFQCL